ncbi:flippase-like domain-containing protein [Candidatus Pacearchaeota archaeon]|nr:flippase-like domain-containing protein [Candidatus Pacearchaeota archaeon]
MKNKNAKSYTNAIGIIVLLLIIAGFIYYIATHLSDFKQLSLVNPIFILYLAIIVLLFSIASGLILKYTLVPFGIKMKFKEWFGLSTITTFYNTITPFRGGMVAKAVYLKKTHKFSYTDFLANYSGIYIINFLASGLLGMISMWFLYKESSQFNLVIFLIFLAFFIPSLGVIIFSPNLKDTKYSIINRVINLINGWNKLRRNKLVVFQVIIITIVQLALGAISSTISYHIFGIELTLSQAFFLVSIGTIAGAFSITPGSLGIAEAVAVFSALAIGITPAQSLTVAILGRAVSTIIIFILGPIFSYFLLKNSKENNSKNEK